MKKYIIILTALLLVVPLTGCEDMAILQEKPKKDTTEGYMNTPEQIEAVMYSCYYQLRRANAFTRYYHSTVEAMADYCKFEGSYAGAGEYQGLDATLTNRLNDMWNILYRSIRFSNTIVLDAPAAKKTSPERLTELLAEARFLRGFAYLGLIRPWGGVPMLTDENQRAKGEHNIPRSTAIEGLEYAAKDLEYAALNLPETQSIVGRPQRTTALTVLAEVYLWLGHYYSEKEMDDAKAEECYEKARDASRQVIQSGTYSLVEVTVPDDFYELFIYELDPPTTTEEIFYLKYMDGTELGSSHAAMLHGSPEYFDGSYTKGIQSTMENKVLKNWDDADLRKAFNIYIVDGIVFNKKFIGKNATGQQSNNDYPLYRYADLLLYYAEAECRTNGAPTADAMEKLNMVHRRGYGKPSGTPDPTVDFKLSDYNTEAKFLDLVLKERGYETCYEGKRYDDLKRMGKLAEVILDVKDKVVGPGGYWFPIPTEEFLYNKGLDVNNPDDQNPGY